MYSPLKRALTSLKKVLADCPELQRLCPIMQLSASGLIAKVRVSGREPTP
jgi:hypothetical protein